MTAPAEDAGKAIADEYPPPQQGTNFEIIVFVEITYFLAIV